VSDSDVAVLAERRSVDARGHGEHLAPLVAAALGDRTPADLGAIVVGTGPGPYTGLRVGLVTAAVLGETLGIPTYGVCSLDGIGAGVDAGIGLNGLLVAADARRKEVYWATYTGGRRVDGPHVDRPADVPLAGVSAAAGAGARLYAEVFGLPLLDAEHPSPATLVRCAADRVRARAPSDPLTPLYLRHPDAVVPTTTKTVTQ
jgi:tRNA threonylcarbamoyl adenosine modification protein YeaZ